MTERLRNKVAIVTGAGSVGPGWGNGKATAVLFAREGARVFAVDIKLGAGEETKAIIDQEGGECTAHRADVSRSDEVKAAVERCIETYGRIDILHNNVGVIRAGGPVETSEEIWDRFTAVNLKSMFLTCKYVLPHMERQGGGAIVNISSIAAIRCTGVPYVTYSTTKAAILQLTQSVALQYAAKNIRANAILPGVIKTPMLIEMYREIYGECNVEKMIERRSKLCPMERMGDGWDVAHAALFLASDEAKYITGTQLIVDGGITCKYA